MGMATDVDARVLFLRRPDAPSWMGFTVKLPLPASQDLNKSGFSTIYHSKILSVQYGFEALIDTSIVNPSTGGHVASSCYPLEVQFPRDTK
jgi:hypothetical protein